ncbi:glycoside hydrolase family 3 C-terminal domain-containing protein, partial [candidate division KSB1 bacterium]|nr:glycoside hydrolase family 3 C-terminal domain-containing protein [candidate division KSB1 bacterium]
MFAIGLFDPQAVAGSVSDSPAHQQIAKQVAEAGIVLLRNEKNLLPLDLKKIKSIAVIGPNADKLRWGGGGSAYVTPNQAPSPLAALKNQVGAKVKVRFAPGILIAEDVIPIDSTALMPPAGASGKFGLLGEYFDNMNFQGAPVLKRIDRQINFYWGNQSPEARVPVDYFSARWTGKIAPSKTAQYSLNLTSDDGSRLYFADQLLIDNWGNHGMLAKSAVVRLEAGKQYEVRIELYENGGDAGVILSWNRLDQAPIQAAIDLARQSDVALVFAGNNYHVESEGGDRDTLTLAANQAALIRQIAAVNPRTVVILNSGAPVLINDWLPLTPALIQSWFPGQAGGQAIVDILLGNVNPSGKLPFTWLQNWEAAPAFNNYPGQAGVVKYAEGIFVGYRYFDQNHLTPLFPFGYGLSYTTFEYQDLKISPPRDALAGVVTVSLAVKNTGTREGAEVVQLYVQDEISSLARPPQELKGFQKVFLKPGASQTVVFELDRTAFAFYDPCQKQWVTEPGRFQIRIGNSSRDIRLQGAFELTQ